MSQKKHELNQLRTSLLSRGFSLAKASIKAGGLSASNWLNSNNANRPGWLNQMEMLVQELGQLKGTAMKVGQTLSMYGETLFPKEVNELLKKLQQNSPPVSWIAMHQVLLEELGEDRLTLLEIEQIAVASASIGQVYRATIKATGEIIALKVQYPGVALAVETDLKLLKFLLSISDLVPRGPRFDQIFTEIKEMFLQEIDYTQERQFSETFYNLLKDDPRYFVPKVYSEFCTGRVMATQFIEGHRADSAEVQALSQERRNKIGINFLEMYWREPLQLRLVQTDPHLGNYLVHIDSAGTSDRLVLFDFGAVRSVPVDFLRSYRLLIQGGVLRDARSTERGGRALGLLLPEDTLELVKDYIDLCYALTEPFALPTWPDVPPEFMSPEGQYDWRGSDLPKRVASKVGRIAASYRLRAPPRELIFLDRKLAGVFIFLSVLGCKLSARAQLLAALEASAEPDLE